MARRQSSDKTQAALPFPRLRPQAGSTATAPGALQKKQRKALMGRLRGDGERIAAHFGLLCRGIVAERSGVVGHYGICYEDGLIKIRLQHATRGTPLKYSSLMNTLCHELAHLKFFDHQEGFRRFYARLLGWARAQGLYRPRDVGGAADPRLTQQERCDLLASLRSVLAGGERETDEPEGCGQLALFPHGSS